MHYDVAEIATLFELPFSDLIYRAQTVHRRHFDPNRVQLSTLLSIKTGGCSEDCGYCSQSARNLNRPRGLPARMYSPERVSVFRCFR